MDPVKRMLEGRDKRDMDETYRIIERSRRILKPLGKKRITEREVKLMLNDILGTKGDPMMIKEHIMRIVKTNSKSHKVAHSDYAGYNLVYFLKEGKITRYQFEKLDNLIDRLMINVR